VAGDAVTPEERARHFIKGSAGDYDEEGLIRALTHEFRLLIAEDRDACAALAISICPGPCGCGKSIATAIHYERRADV